MSLSTSDIRSLQHALGITDGQKEYRNYYAADPYDAKMERLVRLGLMERGRVIAGGLQYFHVTECGRELAYQELDRPKLSRSQKRYLRYLDLRDIYPDMTFEEFILNRGRIYE